MPGKYIRGILVVLIAGCVSQPADHEKSPSLDSEFVSNDIISCLIQVGKIRYVRDPRGQDYWQTPSETRELGQGDCEDIAILMHHLLGRKGIASKVVVGLLKSDSKHGHCWIEYLSEGQVHIIEPRHAVVRKRKKLPKSMYIPVMNIKTVRDKFRGYHGRTGVWLNDIEGASAR